MIRKLLFTLFWVASFISAKAVIGDSTEVKLSAVEVSAQMKREFAENAVPVRVISRQEIAQLPVNNLDELLESLPGIDVRQRSTGGTQADISIRGGSFDQVLILLNGVNITDPQTGHHSMDIPVDFSEISRIEILSGAAARRYGNQAFSGAINIVTKTGEKNQLRAGVNYGSFNTAGEKLAFSLGNQQIHTLTSVVADASDGYISNTDYHKLNVFHQTSIDVKKAGRLDLQLAYLQKSFGAEGFYSLAYPHQFEHTRTAFGTLSWNKTFGKWDVSADAYWRKHYDRFELFRNFENALSWYKSHNYHMTDVLGGGVKVSRQTDFGKFNLGTEIRNEHIFSNALGTNLTINQPNPVESEHPFTKEAGRFIETGFIDYQLNVNRWNFTGGFSMLHSNDYGWQSNYGADVSYQISSPLKVFASVNTASRLPTFTDLYLQNSTQKGNANLQPEKSLQTEAGIRWNQEKWNGNFSVFQRNGRNIIDWVKYPGQTKWESMNITSLQTRGIELDAKYIIGSTVFKNIGLAYTFLSSDKTAVGYDSKYALDYLRHQLNFSLLMIPVERLSMQWNVGYQQREGTYTDFKSGILTHFSPFVSVNERTSYQFGNWKIYVDLFNLLNQETVDYSGLPLPKLHLMAGIQCELK